MNFLKNIIVSCIIASFIFVVNGVVAQTMTSGTYKIQSDSLNFSGNHSSSGSYTMEDTVGEIATGESSSSSFKAKAGYQQMQESIFSITPPTNVTMSPSIGGVSGGTANGSTNFTVLTDDPAGYAVTIKASSTPALQSSSDTIADYITAGSDPDFSFAVPSTATRFGFTVEGNDIAQKFKDNGSACNTGSSDTSNSCWAALSTSDQTIVSRTSGNNPSGTVTTLKFRVQSGAAHVQTNGTYVATTTITLLPL